MAEIAWAKDSVNAEYRPTLYPGERADDWAIPEEISNDFHRLNSVIEAKYSREYLKICAFYNKMFPSLKAGEWSQTSYNVQPFTAIDQERSDTGTGTNYNYLKQIVDQITSRLGTISFVPMLISEDQNYEYVVYKDEVERILRMLIRNDEFNRTCLEAFHNAAVLGYSHVFIDPYTGKMVKANDYEVGMFESQFNRRAVKQMLYRDYAFPVSEALNYLVDLDEDELGEMLESLSSRQSVDLKIYFNCLTHTVHVIVDNKALPEREYPFDEVLMATFQWDTGFARHHTTSEFDLLYPIQREINKIAAKIQQIVRMYKGSVPVFSTDVDLAIKSLTNGAGEALYIDSARSATDLMTVINPTPLDPQLSAQIQEYKTAMYELAGIQNASFNMENMRSAAAVIALDQTRDAVFQSQMAGMSQFIKDAIGLYIRNFAAYPDRAPQSRDVDWDAIARLIGSCYINLQPVHLNDPLSDEQGAMERRTDYIDLACSRCLLKILKGQMGFATVPYFLDRQLVTAKVAATMAKFEALGIDIPKEIHLYLMDAFLDAVKRGEARL